MDAKADCDSRTPQRGVPTNAARREIFVLTSEEKRTVCFVLIAFLLGLATKHYRDAYPAPLSKPTTTARGQATPKP